MLKPIACEVLARLTMTPLDPATGNDSRASSSKSTNDNGKVLMIGGIHLIWKVEKEDWNKAI